LTLSASSKLVAAVLALALMALAAAVLLRPTMGAPLPTASPEAGVPTEGESASPIVESPTAATGVSADPAASRTTAPGHRATPRPTTRPTAKPPGCKPTDQDRYVYNPSRLEVAAACIRVIGTVQAIRHEADGDLHIDLALDPAYRDLLTPANQGEELGDLVVEPVCVRSVSQTDAIAICASDPDPLPGPLPTVGEHVWMEGRYVFDLEHGGWAELHPLYRWGAQ
jgi:hypothetical protein